MVDTTEHYFEKVGIADMLIQMKEPYRDTISRAFLLKKYKGFLQRDVEDFTEEELRFCQDVFRQIQEDLQSLSNEIIPSELRIIKTKGNHYGGGAYYTRMNMIVIPANVLAEDRNRLAFYETMLHELFHIYSRYHPEKRETLYRLIGFEPLGGTEILTLGKDFQNQVLLNPDGIDFAYSISIKKDEKSIPVIPILYSKEKGYTFSKPAFFDYLNFQLFPILPADSTFLTVQSNADGSSPIVLDSISGFYEQIQTNTNYIIHPDEILADNFIFMVNGMNRPRSLEQFSVKGRELINEMERVLRL